MSEDKPKGKGRGRRAMIWVASILGALVLLALGVMVIGSILPETYQATVRMTLAKPPETVWAELTDPKKHPVTGEMARSVSEQKVEANGLPSWVEDLGETQIDVRTIALTRPSHLERRLADRVVPMTADVIIDLEPAHGGSTRITATNRTTIRAGTWHVPIFRIIMSLTGAESSLKEHLKGVAQSLGEPANFQ